MPVIRGCRFKFRAAREERELVSTGNVDGDGARYARRAGLINRLSYMFVLRGPVAHCDTALRRRSSLRASVTHDDETSD